MRAKVIAWMVSEALKVPRLSCSALAFVSSTALASTAIASPERASAEADARFREGLVLLEARRFDEACSALEQSLALERAIGTLLNLGRCYEATRRPASAFLMYQDALREAEKIGDAQRARLAAARRDEAEQRAPRVQLVLPAEVAEQPVLLDGRPLDSDLIHRPIRMDPGQRQLTLTDVNNRPHTTTIDVVDSLDSAHQVQTVVAIVVPSAIASDVPKPSSAPNQPSQKTQTQRLTRTQHAPVERQSSNPREIPLEVTLAWGGLIVGVSGVSSGVALGIDAFVDAGAADCDRGLKCSPRGITERQRAKDQLDVAYAIAAVGGAFIVASTLVLGLTSPSSSNDHSKEVKASAQVYPGGVRFGVAYAF